jgi:hypothetical protein
VNSNQRASAAKGASPDSVPFIARQLELRCGDELNLSWRGAACAKSIARPGL